MSLTLNTTYTGTSGQNLGYTFDVATVNCKIKMLGEIV